MRLSVEPGDPGHMLYYENPDYLNAKVTLDGVELKECVTADEELGFVKVYAKGADGKLLTCGNNMVFKDVYGVVKIIV